MVFLQESSASLPSSKGLGNLAQSFIIQILDLGIDHAYRVNGLQCVLWLKVMI